MPQHIYFLGCLIALRGGQYVDAFLVSQLGQSLRVHWPTPRLLSFERLSGVAGINYKEDLTGVHFLESLLQLAIGDAVFHDAFEVCLSHPPSQAQETEVVRQHVEARLIGETVPREEDHHRVFGLSCFELSKFRRSIGGRSLFDSREAMQYIQYVCFGRLLVRKRNDFDPGEATQHVLLAA